MTPPPEQVASHMTRFLDMLDAAFRGYGVADGLPPRFRDAVLATPRHRFVHRFRIGDGPLRDNDADPAPNLPDIYSDDVMRHVDAAGELLPSSNSQPSYVLFLLHLLSLKPGQAVLEIGSGSGWLAAIMAHLVGPEGRVVGIELLADLAAQSRSDLEALGLANVAVVTGDGTRGHADGAPFDRAIITAAAWDVPAALLDQVAEGGRVLVPVELRGGDGCDVTVFQRQGPVLAAERSVPGWFVPLQGGCQDGRTYAFAPPPAGEAVGRHSLPLGISGEGGSAPAARLFRAFLGRTEPSFVAVDGSADAGWRPWLATSPFAMETPPFGLADADGSVALWHAGEIVSYGGGAAASHLARAYARWAALGLPGAGAFHMEVQKTGMAVPANDRMWVEARGETLLVWWLERAVGSWSDLAGTTSV